MTPLTDHVVVCGLHEEGLRVVEQLDHAGVPLLVVDQHPDEALARELEDLGIPLMRADSRRQDVLEEAGLEHALALVCVESEDLQALATALLAREMRPGLRIVVQLRNAAVGRALREIGVVVHDVARLAAPSVAEVCAGSAVNELTLDGRDYVVVERPAATAGSLRELYGELAPLAVTSAATDAVTVAPGRDFEVAAGDTVALVGPADVVRRAGLLRRRRPVELGIAGARGPRTGSGHGVSWVRFALTATDRRVKTALAALAGLIVASVTVLLLGYRDPGGGRMSLVDALYFTVETIGTVGYGDFYFRDQPTWLRLWAIVLMIVGATLATVFFALLTNALISRTIAQTLGRRRVTGLTGHVVVVGAGAVGIAVVEELVARGKDVVVVEADADNRYLRQLRAMSVPVVTADATLPETLRSVGVQHAAAVAVLTSSDLANIETGLAVRDVLGERWHEVPVVLRLFDHRLQRTVRGSFGFHQVRSPATLTAPWFVGAALGLEVLGTFYAGGQPMLVARLTVRHGGGLDGLAMQDLGAAIRVVSLTRADGTAEPLPRRETRLAAGDRAHLIGPYDELLALLRTERIGRARLQPG